MTTIEIPTTKQVDVKEIRFAVRVGPANVSLHGKGGAVIATGSEIKLPAFLDGAPDSLELHIDPKNGKILNWNDIGPDELGALYAECNPVELEPAPPKAKKPRKLRRRRNESDADYAKRVAEAEAEAAAKGNDDDDQAEAAE